MSLYRLSSSYDFSPRPGFDPLDALDRDGLIAVIPSMREELARLAEEIQSLRDQLAMNSRNSGKPPSSDGFAKPRPKSPRAKGKSKTGGQPGHPGQT